MRLVSGPPTIPEQGIHHTSLPNPLDQTSFITGINFATLFRVC